MEVPLLVHLRVPNACFASGSEFTLNNCCHVRKNGFEVGGKGEEETWEECSVPWGDPRRPSPTEGLPVAAISQGSVYSKSEEIATESRREGSCSTVLGTFLGLRQDEEVVKSSKK